MTETPKLEDFPHQDYDKLRYADMDGQGHVNNAVFATLLETGRASLLSHPGINAWSRNAYSYVVVRLEIDFRAELQWPGTVQVGSAIKAIGNSSFTLCHGLFQNGICAATGLSIMVQLDNATRKPAVLGAEIRAVLASLMLKSA